MHLPNMLEREIFIYFNMTNPLPSITLYFWSDTKKRQEKERMEEWFHKNEETNMAFCSLTVNEILLKKKKETVRFYNVRMSKFLFKKYD